MQNLDELDPQSNPNPYPIFPNPNHFSAFNK